MGFLNPQTVLNQLNLRPDMVAADFGCGSGGWVIPLAQKLQSGRIYAIDILEEPLSALKAKANFNNLTNIETIHSDIEAENGSTLPENSVDLVLVTNLLFQAEDKKAPLREAKRILKNQGEILVVDWLPGAPLGPKQGGVSLDQAKKIAQELNLKLEQEINAGQFHWALVFEKL